MTHQVYGLMADVHAANYSSFATIDKNGVNSRLQILLNEMSRCCEETKKAGGDTVVIAGDLFHNRNGISPSIFNPIKNFILDWGFNGIKFRAIPGNHDLQSKESNPLHSSICMLGDKYFKTDHEINATLTNRIVYLPWIEDKSKINEMLTQYESSMVSAGFPSFKNFDLVCHVGIDGTINGMPTHGYDSAFFKNLGFKRVFSGHYHNYKSFGNDVYSIGALAHHNWSDIGTRAGFMIVYPNEVKWFASHAPNFIDITSDMNEEDLPLIVDGNYVRAKIGEAEPHEILSWQENLKEMGAKGVLIESIPASAVNTRSGVTAKSISAVDKSITEYCTEKGYDSGVETLCQEILKESST